MHIRLFAPLSLCLALSAAAPATAVDLEREKASALAADAEFSRVTGLEHLAGFMKFIAPDVATIRPDSPVIRGREGLAQRWERLLGNPALAISWKPISAEVSQAADMAYTVGAFQIMQTDTTGTHLAASGKYCTVWRKDAAGAWKVIFDSGVQDTPPADSTAHKQ